MEHLELENLLQQMTVEEKIGQMIQLTPDFFTESGEVTGPMQDWQMSEGQLYQIGSVLGTNTLEQMQRIQTQYLKQSRLKIPLVFMADVIHGYRTIFPIPLALAGSFDADLIEEVAHAAAIEAANAGIQVTFSPMVDHVQDPRWGRVMESNGEEPVLSACLTKAYVKGYQGHDLTKEHDHIASCVKHFAGYGAVEGGRDYNNVDFSDLALYQNYLPAFKAAIDADVKLVMTAFNSIRGIPMAANQQMIQEVLRHHLQFKGTVISDWAAVAELVAHRVAEDRSEAAKLAFDAGVEIDMMSDCYQKYLSQNIGEAEQEQLDAAVLHILSLKNALGLFEDPFRGLKTAIGPTTSVSQTRLLAKKAASESIVLLKNAEHLLPLKHRQKVLLAGNKADSQDILGAWSCNGQQEEAISLAAGLKLKDIELSIMPCEKLDELMNAAKSSEVVLIAVGEASSESGENKSKTSIQLDVQQVDLIKKLAQVNPNIVLVLFNGRPLVLTEVEPYVKAIVEAWFPGSEGGNALADILMGEANPKGKLSMSFPRSIGQIPVRYNSYSTGRPCTEETKHEVYVTHYLDETNEPLYPFGYGLSYSDFKLENLLQSSFEMRPKEKMKLTVDVINDSDFAGKAVVQLYIEDVVTKVARPTKEFKQCHIVELKPHEKRICTFELREADLAYVHADLENYADAGSFNYWVGLDSLTGLQGEFILTDK